MQIAARRLFRGVFVVSFGTLLYEIALIRVLSFTIWYHFAYVVISTALLGFGASGTLLAVRPEIGRANLGRTLSSASIAAGVSGAAFLAFMSALPFDPMKMLESPRAMLLMLAYQVGATVPFFFSGVAISLALREAASNVDRLYYWDLLGAALGCSASVALMNALSPPGAMLLACAVLSFGGASFGGSRALAVVLAAAFASSSAFALQVPLTPAASKHLAQHLTTDRMDLIGTRWTALFRTDVVRSTPESPFGNKDEWGLSIAVPYRAQTFWGSVAHDGSANAPLYDRRQGKLEFLDDHILRMPYLVAPPKPRVLVIGVGGGRDVFTAVRYGASRVTGVELDPATAEFVQGELRMLASDVWDRPDVELIVGEGRHFVERSRDLYDVIQITAVDTLAAQTSGAYVLAENFLYTVEAFRAYLDHLTPGGVVSIVTGEWNPDEPQMTGRMTLVARQALEDRGLEHQSRLSVIHSNHLLTNVLVRQKAFSHEETARLSSESERLQFRRLWLPGVPSHAVFSKLVTTKGAAHEELLETLRYVVDPVTDDRPFFFRFHRWSRLFDSSDYGPFLASALGQVLLVALLLSLTVLGGVFIVVPLFVFRRRGFGDGKQAAGLLLYVLAVGLGFMLLEISLMQRFVLYLGYPTYALSVVLFSLLAALGVGSHLSKRWVGRERTMLPLGLAVLLGIVLAYRTGLPLLFTLTLGAPLLLRIAITVAALAPLGVVLGGFFPLGIRRAEQIHPDLVPWAWGVNGCASVTASVLAVVLGMEFGFVAVWVLALAIYAAGVAAFLAVDQRGRRFLASQPNS